MTMFVLDPFLGLVAAGVAHAARAVAGESGLTSGFCPPAYDLLDAPSLPKAAADLPAADHQGVGGTASHRPGAASRRTDAPTAGGADSS
jgi:hypothetical protein